MVIAWSFILETFSPLARLVTHQEMLESDQRLEASHGWQLDERGWASCHHELKCVF